LIINNLQNTILEKRIFRPFLPQNQLKNQIKKPEQSLLFGLLNFNNLHPFIAPPLAGNGSIKGGKKKLNE